MGQCRGATQSGHRCRREVGARGSRYCHSHYKDQAYHPPEAVKLPPPVVVLREDLGPHPEVAALLKALDIEGREALRQFGANLITDAMCVGLDCLRTKEAVYFIVDQRIHRRRAP